MSAFKAGKCPKCATVQFPQLPLCVTESCATPRAEFEQVSLADEPAKVLTYTADWLSYHPAPPLNIGFVQFESESTTSRWDGSQVWNTRRAAKRACEEAGIADRRKQVSLMEVHDRFSITELVTMEDLFISEDGKAVSDILNGFYDREGGGVPYQGIAAISILGLHS